MITPDIKKISIFDVGNVVGSDDEQYYDTTISFLTYDDYTGYKSRLHAEIYEGTNSMGSFDANFDYMHTFRIPVSIRLENGHKYSIKIKCLKIDATDERVVEESDFSDMAFFICMFYPQFSIKDLTYYVSKDNKNNQGTEIHNSYFIAKLLSNFGNPSEIANQDIQEKIQNAQFSLYVYSELNKTWDFLYSTDEILAGTFSGNYGNIDRTNEDMSPFKYTFKMLNHNNKYMLFSKITTALTSGDNRTFETVHYIIDIKYLVPGQHSAIYPELIGNNGVVKYTIEPVVVQPMDSTDYTYINDTIIDLNGKKLRYQKGVNGDVKYSLCVKLRNDALGRLLVIKSVDNRYSILECVDTGETDEDGDKLIRYKYLINATDADTLTVRDYNFDVSVIYSEPLKQSDEYITIWIKRIDNFSDIIIQRKEE